jgi:hypothetical protein
MHTRDIPNDQWRPFFDSFTRLHRGEPVNVELMGCGTGPASALCDQPLVGVVASADRGHGACIEVTAGADPQPQSHTIQAPSHVSVTESDDGHSMALQITADDGSVTLLRFEPENYTPDPPANYLG